MTITTTFRRNTMTAILKTISTTRVRELLNLSGSQYFSKSNVKYFGTILASRLAYTKDNKHFWFVTGEQYATDSIRRFTIRVYNAETHEVETFGDFQGYENTKIAVDVTKDCI
jgi:hypothetical protein